MSNFSLYNKNNKKSDLSSPSPVFPYLPHIIEEEKWKEFINSNSDFFWFINSPHGQLNKNHPDHPLDPKFYYRSAYWQYDIKKGYSDIMLVFHHYCIDFRFPRITPKRLEMMWSIAEELDCHLVIGTCKIIDEKKFLKLKEKYAVASKKNQNLP
jgi:hypothetical protein